MVFTLPGHRFSHGAVTGNSGNSVLAASEGCNGGCFFLPYQAVTRVLTEMTALMVCFSKFN
jgi:hypothetical protein